MNKLSTERIALVSKDKGLKAIDLDVKEVSEIKELADYILTVEEFVRNVRTGHPYNLDAFIPVPIDETPDRVEVGTHGEGDTFDIIIDNKLALQVSNNSTNYLIDFFSYDAQEEDNDESYGYIKYITCCEIKDKDLARDEDED